MSKDAIRITLLRALIAPLIALLGALIPPIVWAPGTGPESNRPVPSFNRASSRLELLAPAGA